MHKRKLGGRLAIVGGVIIVVGLCYFPALFGLTFVRSFIAHFRPAEHHAPSAPFFSAEDIKRIEIFLGVEFPPSTKKIHAYCNSRDLCHVYTLVEFGKEDIINFKKNLSWETPSDVDLGRIEVLNWPVKRVFVGVMSGSEDLGWWKPDKTRIRWVHRTGQGANSSTAMLILLEEQETTYRAYIKKDSYVTRIPKEIETVFPYKPNWDLRESAEYPKREE